MKLRANSNSLLPKVSIVTPSFNQGDFIEETILSVINQSYPNIEYIIMDGGSNDKTLEVIRKYKENIFFWESKKDKGQADAVNKGWRMSTGEILGWINSDDVYATRAVERAVSTLLLNPTIGFVYGDAEVIDTDGNNIGVRKSHPFDINKLITFDLVLSQPTVFFRRSLFETIGALDVSLQMSMDTDYWFRLGRMVLGKNITSTMAYMRSHCDAKTIDRYAEFFPDSLTILYKTFNDPTLPKSLKALRSKSFSRAYYGAAGRAYRAGVRRQILPSAFRAIYTYPHLFDIKTYLSIMMCIDAIAGTSILNKVASFHPRRILIQKLCKYLG